MSEFVVHGQVWGDEYLQHALDFELNCTMFWSSLAMKIVSWDDIDESEIDPNAYLTSGGTRITHETTSPACLFTSMCYSMVTDSTEPNTIILPWGLKSVHLTF